MFQTNTNIKKTIKEQNITLAYKLVHILQPSYTNLKRKTSENKSSNTITKHPAIIANKATKLNIQIKNSIQKSLITFTIIWDKQINQSVTKNPTIISHIKINEPTQQSMAQDQNSQNTNNLHNLIRDTTPNKNPTIVANTFTTQPKLWW